MSFGSQFVSFLSLTADEAVESVQTLLNLFSGFQGSSTGLLGIVLPWITLSVGGGLLLRTIMRL